MSSLAILNLPLRARPDTTRRQLVLCWNKDAPYSVRILTTGAAPTGTAVYQDPPSKEAYKVEVADLSEALHHCAHIVCIENHAFYEDVQRSKREHARGWIRRNPRPTTPVSQF